MNTKFGTIRNMGPNIKKLLKEKEKTQGELAEAWGVEKASACNLLSGKRKIDTEKALIAADFLGCTVYELIQTNPGSLPANGNFEEEHGGESYGQE